MAEGLKSKEDDIQHEVLVRQKFTLAGAIGRQAGGAMKGASPIPKLNQVIMELIQFIDHNLSDSSGALKSVLQRRVKANEVLIDRHLDQPLVGLKKIIQPLLEMDIVLYEFVRQVDVRWGQIFRERPHFQQPGQLPHPDDEYTHESVKSDLMDFMKKVENAVIV